MLNSFPLGMTNERPPPNHQSPLPPALAAALRRLTSNDKGGRSWTLPLLLNGLPGRVHHPPCVREQTNKMKCSLKVGGKDDGKAAPRQTMMDEPTHMTWGEERCSISSKGARRRSRQHGGRHQVEKSSAWTGRTGSFQNFQNHVAVIVDIIEALAFPL